MKRSGLQRNTCAGPGHVWGQRRVVDLLAASDVDWTKIWTKI
ncbi:hypothetical protein DB30_07518 [Enhygromyxa salina]|uniref:Uncharacterized protein n=1 Tax=Enhygromyxa salina TaxID=215803 RepID=A0A0C2CW02_9BACT|nr:hypothetical protein DB30_07518 [Enhygromyxa salina]